MSGWVRGEAEGRNDWKIKIYLRAQSFQQLANACWPTPFRWVRMAWVCVFDQKLKTPNNPPIIIYRAHYTCELQLCWIGRIVSGGADQAKMAKRPPKSAEKSKCRTWYGRQNEFEKCTKKWIRSFRSGKPRHWIAADVNWTRNYLILSLSHTRG